MSCVFRISGESLDIDALLHDTPLQVDSMWKKGDPRVLKDRYHTASGATFLVSDAGMDNFAVQLEDAAALLASHGPAIARLAGAAGIDDACFDFAVALNRGFVSHTSYFPAPFLRNAGMAGIGVAISHYACSDDDSEN